MKTWARSRFTAQGEFVILKEWCRRLWHWRCSHRHWESAGWDREAWGARERCVQCGKNQLMANPACYDEEAELRKKPWTFRLLVVVISVVFQFVGFFLAALFLYIDGLCILFTGKYDDHVLPAVGLTLFVIVPLVLWWVLR